MDAETATGRAQLAVILLGRWTAAPEHENPVRLPGATLWRAPLDLRVLPALAVRVDASWLLVGDGIDDAVLLRAGAVFKQLAPAVRHALLGPPDDVDRCEAWLRRGASAYLAATGSVEHVLTTLGCSRAENLVAIDECFQQADLFRRIQSVGDLSGAGEPLTARELAVLRLIRQGLSNAEIADALSITENTVQTHVRSVLRKLHVASRARAAELARRLGL